MKRREFIVNTSLAGLGLQTVGFAGAPILKEMMYSPSKGKAPLKIKKSLKYGMIKTDGSVLEKFQLIKDLGYDGVELDSPNDLDTNEILDAKEKTGLEIPGVVNSMHWKFPLSHPDPKIRATCVESMTTALQDCKTYGGTTVLLVPGVVNEEIAYGGAWERSRIEIQKMIPEAEKTGIKIAFENVWSNFILSPIEAANYVDQFNHELIGWYFDIGNIVRYGWPEHWIEVLDHRIMKLDVKEYSRKLQRDEGVWKGFNVELMEGDCNWPVVINALDKIGYEGWASAEVPGGERDRLHVVIDKMDAIFDIVPTN